MDCSSDTFVKNVLFEVYNFILVNLQATRVVFSGHSGELLVEYIPAIPLHSTYVIVNGLGWFQCKEHPKNITPFFLSAQGKLNLRYLQLYGIVIISGVLSCIVFGHIWQLSWTKGGKRSWYLVNSSYKGLHLC